MQAEEITQDEMPRTLLQAVRYFSDLALCEKYMRSIKWPAGDIACPNCGASGDRIGEVATRSVLRCKDCRKMIYTKEGTIFQDSPLGLDKWFVAMWFVANCKNGISSHELGRALGVTQKTAWFMCHRIREAMQIEDPEKFKGPTEADTTYIGGKAASMHREVKERKIKGRGASGKAIVTGVLKRTNKRYPSQVRCEVAGADDAAKLLPVVRRNVQFGEEVFTDSATAYSGLADTQIHRAVDHSVRYAEGIVHVNGMENFWALLKRGIVGTYVAVAVFHLFRYVGEQAFRFNERTMDDLGRFLVVLHGAVGKRLTWRVLTNQDDAGFMGIT